MVNKLFSSMLTVAFLVLLVFSSSSSVLATAVSRMSLCNLEGFPGKTIEFEVSLDGTDAEERSGYWEIHYKSVEGDDGRMDITEWITINPEEYTIINGDKLSFNIRIDIPEGATPGLWGATSTDAGLPGHSEERRTYLIFKDTPTGGNVYSGLLIPVSVQVMEEVSEADSVVDVPEATGPVITGNNETSLPVSSGNFITNNLTSIILSAFIVILLIALLIMGRKRRERIAS